MSKVYEPGQMFREAFMKVQAPRSVPWIALEDHMKAHWAAREAFYKDMMNPPPVKDEQTDDSAGVPTLLS